MSQPRNFQDKEIISPGDCVLISQTTTRQLRSTSQIVNYALAVVCTESMLPTKMAREKLAIGATAQTVPIPVWLIGKSEL
jgi:hypothetical protein